MKMSMPICIYNRNKVGLANKYTCIMLTSLSWLEEFRKARQAEAKRKKRAKASWKPVLNGFLKLNVDGSFLPQITHGGTGGVLRNNTGQFQAAFAVHTNSCH